MKSKALKKLSVVILSALLATACEKVIEPKDLPEQDPRIVLNSILYTDSVVKASVSASKSILSGKDYKLIENANCSLYEEGVFVEKLQHTKNGIYLGTKKPVQNKTYTLKVSAAGYKDVEGSTQMIPPVSVDRMERYDTLNSKFVKTDYGSGNGYYIGGNTKFKVWIIDDITTQNFYRLTVTAQVFNSNGDTLKGFVPQIYVSNNVEASGAGNYYMSQNTLSIDDLYLVNGNQVIIDAGVNLYYSASVGLPDIAYADLYFEVSTMSNDLYRYNATLTEQLNSGGINLFAEPVLVHNNIKNGMGIVGSINSDTKKSKRVYFIVQ
jgi:hypothetical protein